MSSRISENKLVADLSGASSRSNAAPACPRYLECNSQDSFEILTDRLQATTFEPCAAALAELRHNVSPTPQQSLIRATPLFPEPAPPDLAALLSEDSQRRLRVSFDAFVTPQAGADVRAAAGNFEDACVMQHAAQALLVSREIDTRTVIAKWLQGAELFNVPISATVALLDVAAKTVFLKPKPGQLDLPFVITKLSPGWYTFVIDQGERLLIDRCKGPAERWDTDGSHMVLSGGYPVLFAGEVCVNEAGEISAYTNKSGAYQTPEAQVSAIKEHLLLHRATFIPYSRAADLAGGNEARAGRLTAC